MITRESLNSSIGAFVDAALTAASIPAERRKSDDPAPADRRSVQIQLEDLVLEPMGDMRRCTQTVMVYFYPENREQYRDEIWTAVNALESALDRPLIVEDAALYVDDDGVIVDMTGEVLEITFSLGWIEVREIDPEIEMVDTLELELQPEPETDMEMEDLEYGFITGN